LIEISYGITGLVRNGGKIQLIASPRLQAEDIEAIERGYIERGAAVERALLRDFVEPRDYHEFERLSLLATLIADGLLDIKIAFVDSGNVGIYHEKLGLIYDGDGNVVAFTGSLNESATAFAHNYEAIDVFCSWTQDAERVQAKQTAFSALWNDCEPSVRIISFPEVAKERLLSYRRDGVNLEVAEEQFLYTTQAGQAGPHIPTDVRLHDYQLEAVDNWEAKGFQGIFDMATGTGKTFTALAAVARLYERMGSSLAVFIVCPYQHLVEQWREDIVRFGMKPIVSYSTSRQRDWKQRLQTAVRGFSLGVNRHFCVVTTNASFAQDFMQGQIRLLKGNVLIVVDEAHNFGAAGLSSKLPAHFPFRLALSATIERHGDEEGTYKLLEYFGEKCIEYTLEAAISNRVLTPYYYTPVPVALNEDELQMYLELTQRIGSGLHKDATGRVSISDYVKMLLIKRARIVAGASEKLSALHSLMEKHKDQSHMLVYCGAATVRDIDYQEGVPDSEEKRQIDMVVDMLGNGLGMRVSKFTSEESSEEREIIKREFAEAKHLQVLVAIRCLDEGVNIPSIRTAFILASSTNPKEYIQRRGRVLRMHPGKSVAHIYDFITLPIALDSVARYPREMLNSIKSLAIKELTRMRDFASLSENPSTVDKLISAVSIGYDIQPDDKEEHYA